MFKYWGFGLHIASEIQFPELLPADFSEADITITLGNVPDNVQGEIIKKKAFSIIGKDEYLLNVKNVCRYYVSSGNKIVAQPFDGIDERSIRLFLLGTAMGAILYQRGDIPLHASAIVKDGKLIIFTGNSGSGKSTLLAQLVARGYEIFTDDICVLHRNTVSGNSDVVGTASYPMIKLWEDAISSLGNDLFTKDFKVRPQLPKYGQFFYDTFNSASLPVNKIFILKPVSTADKLTVDRLMPLQAFKQLEKMAYKYQLIASAKLRAVHFSLLSLLTGNVPVYEVIRPLVGTSAEQLCDEVINFF